MQKTWKFLQLESPWGKVVILLVLALLYGALFLPLITFVGRASAALVAVPVAAAGWLFGPLAGFVAGLLSIGLHTGLFFLLNGVEGVTSLLADWPGNLMVIAAGYSVGLIRKELGERARMGIELSSRERFISILSLAARDVLDPNLAHDDRYFYLASHLANLFMADYAYVLGWNASRGEMTLLTTTRPNIQHTADFALESDNSASHSLVIANNQALVLNSDSPPSLVNLATLRELSLPPHSEFALPLVSGKYQFGAVVFGFESPRHISAQEIIFAPLAGSQVALALRIAEQDAQIKKQLREAQSLSNIGRALSETEKVGLETLLQLIADSTQELIPVAQKVVLHLLDAENQVLIPRAVAGESQTPNSKLNMRLGEGIAGQVIASGKSISIPDVQTDQRFLYPTHSLQYRSLIVAPIKKQQQKVLGSLSIDSKQANAFTPDDERLLELLGVQAAIAIENASLLETIRQDLQEIRALHHIGRALATTLNPDELFSDTVNLLFELFGFYHIQIFVADTLRNKMVARAASGEHAAQLLEGGYEIEIGAGIVGHVAEIGEPFVTNNVEAVVFYMRHPLLTETQSELTIPIKTSNQVLGVLDIQERPPRQFSPRQMNLMAAVADQLAVALEKANLYQELQTALHQEKEMRDCLIQNERLALAGKLLASVSHELNNPLQAIQNALFLIQEDEHLSKQGKQDLSIILAETERMASLISRLRATYRAAQAEDFQPTLLNDIVEDVHALTATYMRHRKITFNFHPDPDLPLIPVIPDKIRQVVLNLVINAIEAMPEGGQLTILTAYLPQSQQAQMTFLDTGAGINPAIQDRIFEPFVTDKETGTGLGLTITADIIRQHQGEIRARNNPSGGAIFEVCLPIRREE